VDKSSPKRRLLVRFSLGEKRGGRATGRTGSFRERGNRLYAVYIQKRGQFPAEKELGKEKLDCIERRVEEGG